MSEGQGRGQKKVSDWKLLNFTEHLQQQQQFPHNTELLPQRREREKCLQLTGGRRKTARLK